MLGLPFSSFMLLFVLPGLVVSLMFYGCWRIRKEPKE
jgi:hypothetical protein